MKSNSDELRLLDAALADETWHSCHELLRSEGLATLRAAKRSRSIRISCAQISTLVLLLLAAWWNLSPRTVFSSRNGARAGDASRSISRPSESQQSLNPLLSSRETTPYITEEQMLALFPKGSCVLAEINGQTELVFFDTSKGRQGFEARHNSN